MPSIWLSPISYTYHFNLEFLEFCLIVASRCHFGLLVSSVVFSVCDLWHFDPCWSVSPISLIPRIMSYLAYQHIILIFIILLSCATLYYQHLTCFFFHTLLTTLFNTSTNSIFFNTFIFHLALYTLHFFYHLLLPFIAVFKKASDGGNFWKKCAL